MLHESGARQNPSQIEEDYSLTNGTKIQNWNYPAKRKQALLRSNLLGIAGAKKSQMRGTRSSDRVLTHHFGPYLKKPKKLSAILGLDNIEL